MLRSACVALALGATLPASTARADALLEKAKAFREALVARHVAAEGFVMYEVDLRKPFDAQHQVALADTPTFTGLWAASSCDRAAVETGAAREEALADAKRALDGLRFLMAVTGRPGLLARGVIRGPVPPTVTREQRWFRGAIGFEEYAWIGDTSHDQYANGLLPAIGACRSLLPEPARELAVAFAGLLEETGMQLVDPDGRRTRFGDLSRRAGYGFNSIAKLAGYGAFAFAAALDPEPRFRETRDRLRDEDRMVDSSLRTNVRILGITNFSNDLMAWNLYRSLVPLARESADPALRSLERGADRAWKRVARDQNPYFTGIFCQVRPERCPEALRAQALATLERFPLEKRRLAPAPELAEIPRSWIPGRKWRRRARSLVPIELRPASSLEWKSSPYRIDARTLPHLEYTGIDYLLAYWALRRSGRP